MAQLVAKLEDRAQTAALASRLAPLLSKGDVVLLRGALGVGKTTFVQDLLYAMGGIEEVISPTFTLVQCYELPSFPVYHFDLYRLKVSQEIEELGFDEALGAGLSLVEWPEKAESYMPRDALVLTLSMDKNGARQICAKAPMAWEERLRGIFDEE